MEKTEEKHKKRIKFFFYSFYDCSMRRSFPFSSHRGGSGGGKVAVVLVGIVVVHLDVEF